MPATTQVKVLITARDDASKVLSGLGRQMSSLGRSAQNLGADFAMVGKLTLGALAGLAAFGVKAGMSAARIKELGFALEAIAKANNISQDAVAKTVKGLENMNIATDKAMETTAMFMQGQLDLTDSLKLAKVAQDLAVLGKMDSSEATQRLTAAILSQRTINLREFKIITTLNEVYSEYAETIGKTASALTETEKRNAFLNKILKEGEKVAGVYDASMESVSKRFRSLTGRILPNFIAKIGEAFEPALAIVVDEIANSLQSMSLWITENKDQVAIWGEKIGEAATIAVEGFKKFISFISENKEIILGVLAALAVGVMVLVGGFLAAHAVAIVAFAGIVAAVTIFAMVWENVVKGAEFWINAFLSFIQTWVEGVKGWLLYYVAVWQFAFAVIKAVIKAVVDWFWGWAGPTIKAFFSLIEAGLSILVAWFKAKWEAIKAVVVVVVSWFMTYVYPTIEKAFNSVKKAVTELWNKFKERFDEIKEKVEGVINFIRTLIDNFRPKIKIGLELPNVEEAWRNLKERARAVGVPGFQTGGIVPGPIGAPQIITAHGGERVIPAGVASSTGVGGGGITFQVYIGLYAGAETEKRNVARELYAALVQVAQSQNKTVKELMGA